MQGKKRLSKESSLPASPATTYGLEKLAEGLLLLRKISLLSAPLFSMVGKR